MTPECGRRWVSPFTFSSLMRESSVLARQHPIAHQDEALNGRCQISIPEKLEKVVKSVVHPICPLSRKMFVIISIPHIVPGRDGTEGGERFDNLCHLRVIRFTRHVPKSSAAG